MGAPPRTVTDNGEGSYNTNVDVEDSYNTNDKLVEVEDSYNTNEKIVDIVDIVEAKDSHNSNQKIVDQSAPVTCGTPPAAKITKESGENSEDEKIVDAIKPY